MRYTLFLPSSLFPLCSYMLPAPCSLLPKNQKFVPHKRRNYRVLILYLIGFFLPFLESS
ncbi:hypothetical protein [Moorena producens]|uniref:hypothetical protein n=1 Tax=Moorena producens TaxID=1155739 RepID=UPI0013140488|nr:hypothetical protein [Moorena producens]